MRKFLLIALFLFITMRSYAQESLNIADLDFLYKSIKAMPSYKDQLKNDKSYHQLYERLRKELHTDDDFEVYQKLLQLIYPIRDNHLLFYRKPDSAIKFNHFRPPFNLAEIEAKYTAYPKDSLEGFYYNYNGTMRYVLSRQSPTAYYLQNLTTGIVEAILNKTGTNSIDAICFLNPPIPYVLCRNIKLSNGTLVGLGYQKGKAKSYASLNSAETKYEYKELEPGFGYLRLSSFNSSNENIRIATDFLLEVKPDIHTPYLIVDLRNNGGGGYKTSGQFAKFLNKYKGRIYILQNSGTISNAEQFIINIKGERKVVTLGETTRGAVTYGSNYGKTIAPPSNRFLFYPTDMSGRVKDLVFEGIGVKPDIQLNAFTGDWISQTIKYVKEDDL